MKSRFTVIEYILTDRSSWNVLEAQFFTTSSSLIDGAASWLAIAQAHSIPSLPCVDTRLRSLRHGCCQRQICERLYFFGDVGSSGFDYGSTTISIRRCMWLGLLSVIDVQTEGLSRVHGCVINFDDAKKN